MGGKKNKNKAPVVAATPAAEPAKVEVKAPEPVKKAPSPVKAPAKSPAPAKAATPKKAPVVAEEKKEVNGETADAKAERIKSKILGKDLFHRIGGAYANGVTKKVNHTGQIREQMGVARSNLDEALKNREAVV